MEEHIYPHLYRIEKEHWWYAARLKIILDYIQARLDCSPGMRILDVGCGTGAILEEFSRHFHAFGLDFSEQAIEFCRQRGLTNLHAGTLQSYPRGETFDALTMLDVVEHVEDDLGLLNDARALLRTGGHLLITVPAFPSLWGPLDVVLHHKRRYTRRQLRSLVHTAGYVIEHLTFFNTLLFPVAVIRRLAARVHPGRDTRDLDIPSPAVNNALKRVFGWERYLLPRSSLPLGLSLLCLARVGEK